MSTARPEASLRRGLWLLAAALVPTALLAWAVWSMVGAPEEENLLRLDAGVFVPQGSAQVGPPSLLGVPAVYAAPVALPHDWRGQYADARTGWYLFDIDLTVAPDRVWGVWLPRVAHDARIFVNGRPLAGGLDADAEHRNPNAPRLGRVVNGRLVPGVNRLAIQVTADRPGNGFLSAVYLGPYSDLLARQERVDFVRMDLLRIIVAAMLMLAALTALLWFWRRRDAVFGWFSVMMLAWAAHDLYPLMALPATVSIWHEWFWHATLVVFVFTVCGFVMCFTGRFDQSMLRRFAGLALLMPSATAALAAVDPAAFLAWGAPVSDTVALLLCAYPMGLTLGCMLREPTALRAGMVAAGAFPMILGAHDWLVINAILPRDHGFLMPLGSVLIMVVYGGYLMARFGRVLTDLEVLNARLEARVREREAEIAVKHERLLRLETERALLEERARLMSDMHDGLGGTLISTLAMVQAGQTNPELLAGSLRDAIDDLRLMIDSLDPVDGDLGNVMANMRMRLEPKLRAAGIRLEWSVADVATPEWLGATGVLQVMRVVQESINNVLKHAGARRIRIELSEGPESESMRSLRAAARRARHESMSEAGVPETAEADESVPPPDDERVWVAIIDDGVGLTRGTRVGGRGMGNMRRRAARIGSELSVMPADPGTCVLLSIPRREPAVRG